jgi:anti-anti-sigma factor
MPNAIPMSIRQASGKTLIDLDIDNVDFRNAEILKSMLSDLVQGGSHHIVLNLKNVNFMDSSGLSVLLTGKRLTEEAGGNFGICNLQGYVNNLVNLTNLNKTISVFSTDYEAVN